MDLTESFQWLLEFPKNYPAISGWFSSAVSAGVLFNAWRRPVIRVQYRNTRGCYGDVPLTIKIEDAVASQQVNGKYVRLRIKNSGGTTIKNCSGHLQAIATYTDTHRDYFDSEVVRRGWANNDSQPKIDIPPKAHFYMDVATILLSGDNSRSGMSRQDIPTTLAKHLAELRQAQTTFIFEIRVDADNARLACTRFG